MSDNSNPSQNSRRSFLKTTTAATAAVAAGSTLNVGRFAHGAGTRETVRIGLIGCGGRGSGAIQNALNASPQNEVVGLCDMFEDRLKFCRKTLETKRKDQTKVTDETCFLGFDGYKQLLETDIDVVLLCTPPYFRPMQLRAAIEAGKHVFCEKPPGKSVNDIENVIVAQQKKPCLKLKYGFNHRYHDSVIEAMNIVKSGKLGYLLNIRGFYGKSMVVPFDNGWRCQKKYSGGGILLDQGIHMIDLINQFTSKIVDVKSFVSNDYWKHDVEDNAYALLRDDQNCVVLLHSSATQWQHRFRMDITLSEGSLELHGILSGSKSYGEEKIIIFKKNPSNINGQMDSQNIRYLNDNSWEREITEFTNSIVNDTPIKIGTSLEALESMKLVFKIYKNGK